MRRSWVVAASVAMMATGCATESTIKASDVGTVCQADKDADDRFRLSEYLDAKQWPTGLSWVRVRRPSEFAPEVTETLGPSERAFHVDSAALLAGSARPSSVVVTSRTADEASAELGRGASIVLVSSPHATRVVASLHTDGTLEFLGECAREHLTGVYDDFVAARHAKGDSRSAAAIFTAMATDAGLVAELRALELPVKPTPPTWAELAPERRFIDPDDIAPPPPDVLADLRKVWLHVEYPAGWKTFDGKVATFVPGVGWNGAIWLGVETPDPAVVGYVSRTKPLELWALPMSGGIDAPIGVLGSFTAADVARAGGDVYMRCAAATSLVDAVAETPVCTLADHR